MDLDGISGAGDAAVQTPGGVVARLLEYAPGRVVALPPHTTLEVVEHPQAVPVPGAARHAYGLLSWQASRLPMIDLRAMVDGHPAGGELPMPRYALIVAYQDGAGGGIRHGAIGIAGLPESIRVGDDSSCELPVDSDLWPSLSLSCFRHEGRAVPVIDTARLFAAIAGA